jgi:hypothetical protein
VVNANADKQQPDPYWPWPAFPPIPWDKKQQDEYERQQRQQVPDAPMISK